MGKQQHRIAVLSPGGRRLRLVARPANDQAAVGEAPQREAAGVARLLRLEVVEHHQDAGARRNAGDETQRQSGRSRRQPGQRCATRPSTIRLPGFRISGGHSFAEALPDDRVSRLTSPLVTYSVPSV